MSTNSTGPEEKGFFEKVKETIEHLWDGTKDTAEGIKDKTADTIEHIKDKVTTEKKNGGQETSYRQKECGCKIKNSKSQSRGSSS